MGFDFNKLKPLESGNVDAIDRQDGHLLVRFKGKPTVYSYDGVPADLHKEMLDSKSPGSVFHGKVKGKFAHTKHDPEKA